MSGKDHFRVYYGNSKLKEHHTTPWKTLAQSYTLLYTFLQLGNAVDINEISPDGH